jgi:F-type H+-transporting ATPase subunit delta
MSSVANRYASALLDAADSDGVLDAVERDVSSLRSLLHGSPEFAAFVANPLVPADKQAETLEALFQGKLSDLGLRFLMLLASRARLSDTEAILDCAFERLRERRGILPVSVVAAQALTPAQETALQEKLAARSGKTVLLDCSVDESLLGGFRLKIGDVVEDHSLATKLETFKRNVINA